MTTHWHLDHRKTESEHDSLRGSSRATRRAFAPSSTPSTGRIIDCLSLKKSYHTFTADVTNTYFDVDVDEKCQVDPPAEWLEQ